jgi:putative flippase GtrA
MKAGPALLRYAAVGVAATAAHWALLALLVEGPGLPAWLGSGAGAVLGAQVAFFGNRRFTFGHGGPLWPAWWRFMGTALLGAGFGMVVVGAGVALGLHYLLAQAVATVLVMLLTFGINRAWTFAR